MPPRPGAPAGTNPLYPLLYGTSPTAPVLAPGIGAGIGVGGFGAGAVGAETGATGVLGVGVLNPALALNQGFVTGHPVAFQNHTAYFLNLNAAAGNVGVIGAAGLAGTTQSGTPGFGLPGNQTNAPGSRRTTGRGPGR